MKSAVADILWTILIALVAFLLLRISIQSIKIDMPSMKPTIQPGWWVMLNKVTYRFAEPQRGDIIVFHAPAAVEPGKDFIKRIIGKPGDKVEIRNSTVFVNGIGLREPYAQPLHYTMASGTIPPDSYFVLGDNRDISVDSHYGWFVPRKDIVGKAWFIMWPPAQWGRAPNYSQIGPDAGTSSGRNLKEASQGVVAS